MSTRRILGWVTEGLFAPVLVLSLAGCGEDTRNLAPGDAETGGTGGAGAAADDEEAYFNETSTNWAMVRGYPRGTAYNAHERELNRNTVARLQATWQSPSESYPLIRHGDRVFASHVEGFDADRGTTLWTNTRSETEPVYCGGYLYQTQRRVRAFNPRNGELTFESSESAADAATLFGAATAKGSLIIFPTVFKGWSEAPGDYDSDYRLFDSGTKLTRVVRTGVVTLAPAAATAGRLYFPALRPTGSAPDTAWEYGISSLAFDETANGDDWFEAVDPEGTIVEPTIGVAVLASRVFGLTADRAGMAALNQKTGEVLWRQAFTSEKSSFATSFDAVIAAGSSEDGIVIEGLEPSSGEPLFERTLEGTLAGGIAVGGEVVYVGSEEGMLYALGARDGELLASLELDGPVRSPIVTGGRVFVATGRSAYALGVPVEAPTD
jgi:outer membrane protein assembly factor BamB